MITIIADIHKEEYRKAEEMIWDLGIENRSDITSTEINLSLELLETAFEWRSGFLTHYYTMLYPVTGDIITILNSDKVKLKIKNHVILLTNVHIKVENQ